MAIALGLGQQQPGRAFQYDTSVVFIGGPLLAYSNPTPLQVATFLSSCSMAELYDEVVVYPFDAIRKTSEALSLVNGIRSDLDRVSAGLIPIQWISSLLY